jgi:ABC-type arginine/histidine transport system permease subunit
MTALSIVISRLAIAMLVALMLAACRPAEKKISVRQPADLYFIIFF